MAYEFVELMYEEGKTLGEIAEAAGKTLAEVTELLAASDDSDDLAQAREMKHCRILRRVRSLSDAMVLQYLERLQETINSPDCDDEQKAAAFEEMEKVLKIAKLYSDRVLLAEGKMTENIGLHGDGGLPFQVNFTKTYEQPEETTDDAEDTER